MSESETTTEPRDISALLKRVRTLITRAEAPIHNDPNLDENANAALRAAALAEADNARRMADALMLEAAITDAMVRDAQPLNVRRVPKTIYVDETSRGSGAAGSKVTQLLEMVAEHCRVMVRHYARYDRENRTDQAAVYGWDGDVAYFEMLYTTLRLHMLGILAPRWEPTLSDEENCYRLHNAGYSWIDIAKRRGWRKCDSFETPTGWDYEKEGDYYRNEREDRALGYWKLAGLFKKPYLRACRAKGVKPTRTTSPASARYFRIDAASGYVSRLRQRLVALQRAQEVSEAGALVLKSAANDLRDYMREQNANAYTRCPACGKLSGSPYTCDVCGAKIADVPEGERCPKCERNPSGYCRDHPRGSYHYRNRNEAGYRTGVSHANTADLGGGVGGGSRREVGD